MSSGFRWFLVLLAALFAAAPVARAAEVVRLGSVTLTDQKDRDVVVLPPCDTLANDKVTAIRVEVRRFPAEIDRLRVVFQNGQSQELALREHLKPGTTSRWIDLKGEARCIERIVVLGDTDTPGRRPGKQAQLVFWGRLAAPEATGGIRLGMVRLAEDKDRDVIRLPRCQGNPENKPVQAIRFEVRDHDAEIDRVVVVFQNDQRVELDVRRFIPAGSGTRWLDLPGEKRCIKEILLVGDAETRGYRPKAQATVIAYGR